MGELFLDTIRGNVQAPTISDFTVSCLLSLYFGAFMLKYQVETQYSQQGQWAAGGCLSRCPAILKLPADL